MSKMKMRTKIVAGFASILVLLSIVGVVAIVYLQDARAGFVQYRDWARDSNLVAELNENLIMARLNVKDFLIRGTEQEALEFQEYYDKMAANIASAHEEIRNPERAALVDQIEVESIDYRDAFDGAVVQQGIRDEHYARLNEAGPKAEQALTSILTSARDDDDMDAAYEASLATRNLLLARLYGMKYLDDNATESESRVIEELETMQTHLSTLDAILENPARRALLEETQSQVATYRSSFTALATAIYTRNDHVDQELDIIGPQIASMADGVLRSIRADQDALGPELQASIQLASVIVIVVAAVAILAGLILAILITRGILRQLGEDPAVIEEIAKRVALGDLEIDTTREARGVYESVQDMVKALRYKADVVEKIAQRDLTVEINKASDKDSLGESLIVMRDSLHDLLSQTRVAVEQVAAGSGQVSSASQDLSQGATEQASSLEEITSSINEINGQSNQNADNSTEARNIAQKAVSSARDGDAQMTQLREQMTNISNSSDEITKVVKVIDDIAFQINLLALNANVEAARAGKYGKGFAVVAEEVRNLATRSADAVKETSAMVESSVTAIEAGNNLTDKTADQLQEIRTGSEQVAQFLEEIAAASREQAQAIEQITEGLGQIDQVTQSNTASAEESASAAEELASQAEQLRASIADFKLHGSGDGSRYLGAPATNGTKTASSQQSQTVHALPAKETVAAGARANGNGKRAKEAIELDDDEFDRF